MLEKMVTITEKEYNRLLSDSRFLQALQEAGVDNWDGYSDAQEFLDDMDEE